MKRLRKGGALLTLLLSGIVWGVAVTATPAAVTPESGDGATLLVTGRVFRECTVTMPENGSFNLGTYSVQDWVDNRSWLSRVAPPEFTFTLTGCGEGVKVHVSATGTPVNSGERLNWLANGTGTAPGLAASLTLVKADGNTMPLPLDGTVHTYIVTESENTPVRVTLKGLLNRTDNNERPAGTYRATLTVNFEFV